MTTLPVFLSCPILPRRRRLVPRVVAALLSCLICLLWPLVFGGYAAGSGLDAKVKAAYIYNFTNFVEWPELERGPAGTPIRICVIGNDPVAGILVELSNRTVKGHPLKVEQYGKTVPGIPNCHVVFVSRSEEARLPQILRQLEGGNVLTVSDIPGFSHRGGMIGFVTEHGRMKLEINIRSARQTGVKISGKLLELARVVQ